LGFPCLRMRGSSCQTSISLRKVGGKSQMLLSFS
jgi:hypothetical protein